MHARRTIIAAAAVLAGAAGAVAQTRGTPPNGLPVGAVVHQGMSNQIIGADSTTLSVNFPGGSLEEYIQALRGGTKDPVNISLQGEAAKLHIDAVQLREVSVEAALRAALGARTIAPQTEPDGSYTSTSLEAITPQPEGRSVFVVTTRRAPAGAMPNSETTIEVFSIRTLVQGTEEKGGNQVPEQTVLSAIDSGLRLSGQTEGLRPQIDYHKDSGLLLVRGQPRDVALVKDIVRRMTEDRQRQAADARERRKFEINAKAAMQRADLTLSLCQNRASEAQRRMEETQKLVDAGSASTRDLADARMATVQAEGEVRMAAVEKDRLKEEAMAGLETPGAAGDDEVAQLRGELAKALARIKELEEQVAPKRGGDRSAPKGK